MQFAEYIKLYCSFIAMQYKFAHPMDIDLDTAWENAAAR